MPGPTAPNQTPAKILVLTGDRFACVKIVGRANFASSIDFKNLVDSLRQKGLAYLVMDLSECLLMDSTFLGVLAGFGLQMNLQGTAGDGRQIELYRPNARLIGLIENLGILHLFRVTQEPLALPACGEVQALDPASVSKEDLTRASLEAHRTLMEINPENVARFKEVTRFLAEDLERLRGGASSAQKEK
ncbi:MAG TPA: STAS domain-containing protein [Candidatus Paceibacterota bacterium]|jgi:anti-sigma B factor antagonist|nr:STAS domain-containing protein [Candidatus Paceibacterota bacterium]